MQRASSSVSAVPYDRSMAEDNAMAQVVFNVQMPCGGCSGACTRILSRMEGVVNVDASLEEQRIVVTVLEGSPASPENMLEALLKWANASGKTVSLAG